MPVDSDGDGVADGIDLDGDGVVDQPIDNGDMAAVPGAAPCSPGVPATSQLPRLTKAQYDNTIRDLVGITGEPSAALAPDSLGSVVQRTWDGYRTAAVTLSAHCSKTASGLTRPST
jgi:hypothetical protein